MQIDIKTTGVEPIRQTYAHVARRLGTDKPASRYQEATLDVQSEINFHYRPYWDPDREIFDKARTAVVMEDWYVLKDPRQYYYGAWTIARSRQQDSMERNFSFVEKRDLMSGISEQQRDLAAAVMLPLRHVDYAANLNNMNVTAYGWGTALTQATAFAAMDRLGIAQYLSRIGLLLDGNTGDKLDAAKAAWLEAPEWQPLRKLAEDTLVIEDVIELYVAQNFALDGLLFPLIYDRFDKALANNGASAISMLTEFMVDWQAENERCSNAFIKAMANESDANQKQLSDWARTWSARAAEALAPIAEMALGEQGTAVMAELQTELANRGAKKCALAI